MYLHAKIGETVLEEENTSAMVCEDRFTEKGDPSVGDAALSFRVNLYLTFLEFLKEFLSRFCVGHRPHPVNRCIRIVGDQCSITLVVHQIATAAWRCHVMEIVGLR